MQNKEIPMQTISLEELQAMEIEIGGNSVNNIFPKDFPIGEEKVFLVSTYEGTSTQWGLRIDFILIDEYNAEHKISSWNFVTQQKFKPQSIIGKKICLLKINKADKKLVLRVIN
jgi:hypothetical protein